MTSLPSSSAHRRPDRGCRLKDAFATAMITRPLTRRPLCGLRHLRRKTAEAAAGEQPPAAVTHLSDLAERLCQFVLGHMTLSG
jgi:hypothetical protein